MLRNYVTNKNIWFLPLVLAEQLSFLEFFIKKNKCFISLVSKFQFEKSSIYSSSMVVDEVSVS